MAEKEASAQINDIQILVGNRGEETIINVSTEDIKYRLLTGMPVHFVKEQGDEKRAIKAVWITNALKREYGVEKIDISNTIIIGDLDFHIEDNFADIVKRGIKVHGNTKDKDNDRENVVKETVFSFKSNRVCRCSVRN